MSYYMIATFFSFVTACFTMAASWTKDPHRTFYYQTAQCLVYAVAAYFYGVYPCIIMMLICALRDYLIGAQKYQKIHCLFFFVLALGLGLWTNSSGIVGLLSILATLQITVCAYFLKKPVLVKINVGVNLIIWLIYDFLILDFFSGIVDLVGIVLAFLAAWRISKQ